MRSKQLLLPAVAMLWLLMGGCKKDNVAPNVSSADMSSTLSSAKQQPHPVATVNLGTAGNFVILSKSGISDVPTSAITGNVGSSPITGAAIGVPCTEVTGIIYSVDAAGPACEVINPVMLKNAVHDMQTAYTDAASRATSLPAATYLNLGGGTIGTSTPTLAPGVYTWNTPGTLSITGNITLNGGPNDVFIFQVAGTLTVDASVIITLTGGVKASNIFWQVADVVALGVSSNFEGIILGKTGITLNTSASITGRLLAQTDVTLIQNTVTQPPPVTKGH